MATTTTNLRANALKTTNGFWWANLSSTDDSAAAAFYSRIFGWTWDEMPIGENMVHRNAKLGGHMIAGLDPVMPGSGQPTAWTNFVFVDDIQATWTSALALGATAVAEPMDVMGEGWMAVLLDPQGAALGLWQPGRHTGADAVNQPSTYAWVDLATDDVEGAKRFYGELFGWGYDQMEDGDTYWIATNDGRQFAGIMAKTDEMTDMPSMWSTYFGVTDIEATAAAVVAAGGSIAFPAMRMGPGTGLGVIDPQGGYLVAFQMDEWPTD